MSETIRESHTFTVTVHGASSKEEAETGILVAFAKREPDGMAFHTSWNTDIKQAWMEGSKAGTEIAWELMTKALEKFAKDLGIKRHEPRND